MILIHEIHKIKLALPLSFLVLNNLCLSSFDLDLAFSVAIYFVDHISIIDLRMVTSRIFALWHDLVLPIFVALTVHRGSLHSLLSCVMFTAITVSFTFFVGSSIDFAYLAGLFILLGMVLHLSLDELYSINLDELTVKSSFGTALKPCSLSYPLATILQCVICAVAIHFSPPFEPFLANIKQAIEGLEQDFFPSNEWQMLRNWFG